MSVWVAYRESNEQIAVDIEESIRLNVCAMAVQVFIGGEFEKESIFSAAEYLNNAEKRQEISDKLAAAV